MKSIPLYNTEHYKFLHLIIQNRRDKYYLKDWPKPISSILDIGSQKNLSSLRLDSTVR